MIVATSFIKKQQKLKAFAGKNLEGISLKSTKAWYEHRDFCHAD
jgi:hypothetical protein